MIGQNPSDIHPELFGLRVSAEVIRCGADGKNEGAEIILHCGNKTMQSLMRKIDSPYIAVSYSAISSPSRTPLLHYRIPNENHAGIILHGMYGMFANGRIYLDESDLAPSDIPMS